MEYVALLDSVGYHDADGNTAYAPKGETFTPSDADAKRLLAAGAIAPKGSEDARLVADVHTQASEPAGAADEDELMKMSRKDLVEHATNAGVAGAERMGKPALVTAVRAAGAIGPFTPS